MNTQVFTNDAQRRLSNAVKYVSRQWGTGWNRLGPTIQEALIRAEILADISRIEHGMSNEAYCLLVDRIADIAMQWSSKLRD